MLVDGECLQYAERLYGLMSDVQQDVDQTQRAARLELSNLRVWIAQHSSWSLFPWAIVARVALYHVYSTNWAPSALYTFRARMILLAW